MADESHELRRVNWTELFGFTQIFKGFRMAIHPSKLVLALAAIILIHLVGWGMDWVWSWGGAGAQTGDVYLHFAVGGGQGYADALDARDKANLRDLKNWYRQGEESEWSYRAIRDQYNGLGGSPTSPFGKAIADAVAASQKDRKRLEALDKTDLENRIVEEPWDLWSDYAEMMSDAIYGAEAIFEQAEQSAWKSVKSLSKDKREAAKGQLTSDHNAARRAVWSARVNLIDRRCRQLRGRGLFAVMISHEKTCLAEAIGAVRQGRLFSGFNLFRNGQGTAVGTRAVTNLPQGAGFFAYAFLMLWGPVWLLWTHWVYGVIFLLLALAIWALLGGAIARIAALHAAREEKISISQALRFSTSKFLSFFTAPLIPVVIILLFALLSGLGGLLGTFPVGDIIMAVVFVLAIILGVAITFLSIGTVAGFGLMYPTIAVEGSDSFDAISRSFSYTFARPWRHGLYVVAAVLYGTACYLFVRLFAFLTLLATHTFVAKGLFGLGTGVNPAPELADGATKMDLLFTRPTFGQLVGPMNDAALGGIEWIAAAIIHIWVFLVAGVVAAFVLSFWMSSYTTIYYLLRKKVDATDLDDVYVEELEEPEIEAEQPPADEGETAPEPEAPEAPETPEAESTGDAEEPTEDEGEAKTE